MSMAVSTHSIPLATLLVRPRISEVFLDLGRCSGLENDAPMGLKN